MKLFFFAVAVNIALTGLGAWTSLKPPAEHKHKRYFGAFIFLGFLSGTASWLQTADNNASSQKVERAVQDLSGGISNVDSGLALIRQGLSLVQHGVDGVQKSVDARPVTAVATVDVVGQSGGVDKRASSSQPPVSAGSPPAGTGPADPALRAVPVDLARPPAVSDTGLRPNQGSVDDERPSSTGGSHPAFSSPKEAVEDVLRKYQAAFSHLKQDELLAVYPSLKDIPNFSDKLAFSMTLSECTELQVSPDGLEAEQTCSAQASFRGQAGGSQRQPRTRRTFEFSQVNGLWVIKSITTH